MTRQSFETITLTADDRGVATLTLNRPDRHNAMNATLIDDVHRAAETLAADDGVRVVVLTGADCGSFCAGGDLNWFRSLAGADHATRKAGGLVLARMLRALDTLPKPVIGRINGAAYGGGAGIAAVCDCSIGVTGARFGLTEVRLGLIAATISPYVIRRLGVPNARAVMLSGAPFSAEHAVRIGLLNEVAAPEDLDARIDAVVADHLQAAPGAVAATKRLIAHVSAHDAEENIGYTAGAIADAWESDEGRAGIDAFLNRRPPPWQGGA